MSKGTPSFGKRQTGTHIRCRRCGKHSYHSAHRECAACGFGKKAKLRRPSWVHAKRSVRMSIRRKNANK